MGRVKKESLDELIPAYAENKSILEDYKKICDTENKKIKEYMTDSVYETGGYKATKIVQTRESMNEDKLLEVLQHYTWSVDVIKMKPYVDMDALESLMYKGTLSKEVLMEIDKCRESKEVVTLRVTKIKEKKE